MNPAQSWGWFSPLCLWAEKRMGDERHRTLVKRLLTALLASSAFILAYHAATLPLTIRILWSKDLGSEITSASAFLDARYGPVVAAAVAVPGENPTRDMGRIILLSHTGNELGNLSDILPTRIFGLVCLPSAENPETVIALPGRYTNDPSYLIKPETAKLGINLGNESDEPFLPSCLDFYPLDDGQALIIGYSPEGPPQLAAQIYDGRLETTWVKELEGSTRAKIMMPRPHGRASETGKPNLRILAIGNGDVLTLYHLSGSTLRELNLTNLLLSENLLTHTGTAVVSVRGYQSVLGRQRAGIYISAQLRQGDGGWEPARYFFLILDSELDALEFWEEAPFSLNDPKFVSQESRIVADDTCFATDGTVAWIRRGSLSRMVDDLNGDGEDEVVSVKPSWIGQHTTAKVFSSQGRLLAKGSLPGMSGDLAAADLDSDSRKEMLYYSGPMLYALRIGRTPHIPTLLAEIGLLLCIFVGVLAAARQPVQPHSLRRLLGILARLGLGRKRAKNKPAASSPDHCARIVEHEEYRACDCGAKSVLDAVSCEVCGRRFRHRRMELLDLAAGGPLSKAGLAIGMLGLLIYCATPAVWSVERAGAFFKLVRWVFAALSITAPYPTWWSAVLLVLALAGVCLVYLERSALVGALACLSALGLVLFVGALRIRHPLFPFILIGGCGFLQFAQKLFTRFKPRGLATWPGATGGIGHG